MISGQTYRRQKARFRLIELSRLAAPEEDVQVGSEAKIISSILSEDLTQLQDRFGRSGFIGRSARESAQRLRLAFFSLPGVALLAILLPKAQTDAQAFFALFLSAAIGLYLGLSAWLIYLKYRTREFEREVLFRVPLFLESLILVVESGMGILPALQSVLVSGNAEKSRDPVRRIFALVYRLAENGLPLEQALEMVASNLQVRVLRHVLLHLDISANTGGELIPSLRSLSDHTHVEWRLSVEQRVRRLENLVVFPVFVSVMGLILVTAAVPLVPLLGLKSTLENRNRASSAPGIPSERVLNTQQQFGNSQ